MGFKGARIQEPGSGRSWVKADRREMAIRRGVAIGGRKGARLVTSERCRNWTREIGDAGRVA